MKHRFTLYRRGNVYYCQDNETGKQASLHTEDKDEALTILHSKNEAYRQPALNLQIARAYLAAVDPEISQRTWRIVMDEVAKTKTGVTLVRHHRAMLDKAFDLIRERPILETKSQHFLEVLSIGTVSTNIFLRRLHNFAVDMGWLPWPILVKRRWPAIHFKEKRAVTWTEHQAIIAAEHNPERRAYYECCWYLGAAQSDVARLCAEDIDWQNRVISFQRKKTGSISIIRIGVELERVLKALPALGPLFPSLRNKIETHRSREFARCCKRLGISGISLHSYRYAWAERAKIHGYPERYAQEALGHNSKAVHRAYARKAKVIIPALEDYEKQNRAADQAVVVPMPAAVA